MYIQQSKQSVHDKVAVQKGFTLVELMVSLLLGSLIAAAAFQVFYISQRTATTQSSASSIQDGAVFGLQAVEYDIRLANLGADTHEMTKSTPKGGIVFSSTNIETPLNDPKYADFYTKQAQGSSYYTTNSDQLTIQFNTPEAMVNCEGEDVDAGVQLVQRYFLRSLGTTDNPNFALACDAAVINPKDTSKTPQFGDDGAVIIPNVDQFRVLLMTDRGYKDIDTVTATDKIYGVKLGLVLAGGNPTIQAQNDGNIELLGTDLTVKTGLTKVNTIRRVYEPTILIRNARLSK